jgi:hypothetical protein
MNRIQWIVLIIVDDILVVSRLFAVFEYHLYYEHVSDWEKEKPMLKWLE